MIIYNGCNAAYGINYEEEKVETVKTHKRNSGVT